MVRTQRTEKNGNAESHRALKLQFTTRKSRGKLEHEVPIIPKSNAISVINEYTYCKLAIQNPWMASLQSQSSDF
jgi:hypothetical protein